MNKKYVNICLIFFCIFLIIISFTNSNVIVNSVTDTLAIFFKNVFPFLFIMMVINSFLIKINLPFYLSKCFKNPYIYIFILSLLSGTPSNAIIIKELLNQKIITETMASKALCFSTLNNPLFLFNYFNIIFNDKTITLKLFIIIYSLNLIILLYYLKKENKSNFVIKKNKTNIFKDLCSCITSSFLSLLNILAIIMFFKLICDLLLPFNNGLSSLLKGLIEITQGLNAIEKIMLPSKIKELLLLVILSFSGLCIHMQISNILIDYNINYKPFYLSRLFLIFTCIIILFLL